MHQISFSRSQQCTKIHSKQKFLWDFFKIKIRKCASFGNYASLEESCSSSFSKFQTFTEKSFVRLTSVSTSSSETSTSISKCLWPEQVAKAGFQGWRLTPLTQSEWRSGKTRQGSITGSSESDTGGEFKSQTRTLASVAPETTKRPQGDTSK